MRKDFFLITIGILLILLNITLSVALPFCEMQTGDWILCTETKAGQFNTTSPAITVEFREPVMINKEALVYVADLQGNLPASSPDYEITKVLIGANKYDYTATSHLDDGRYEFIVNATNNNGMDVITQVTFEVNVSAMPIWVSKPTNKYVVRPDFGASTENNFFLELRSERNSMCKYSRANTNASKTLKQNFIDFPFSFEHNSTNEVLNYKSSVDINALQSGYDLTGGDLISISVICNETQSERYSYKTIFLAVDTTPPQITVSSDPQPVLSFEDHKTNLSIITNDLSVCKTIQLNPIPPSGDILNFIRKAGTTFPSFSNFTKEYSEMVNVYVDPAEYNYSLNISCENLANQLSYQLYDLKVNLDITENFEFVTNRPPTYLNSTSVNISGTVVNSYTACDYKIDNSTTLKPLVNIGTSSGKQLLSATETMSEGEHKIIVNCSSIAGTKEKTFKVDTTGPSLDINVSDKTCSLTKIEANFPVTDPNNGSGPDKVYYNISFDGDTTNDLSGSVSVNAGNASLSKSIPSGLEGENFTIIAYAKDNAGNQGAQKTSQKVMVTNSSLSVCDKSPPLIVLNESKNTDTKEWTILVNCTDAGSGCKGEFKYSVLTNQSAICSYSSTKNLMDPITIENSSRLCIAVYDNNNNNATSSKIYDVTYPLYCYNGVQDTNETDVDCGGQCASCDLNDACLANSDCQSNYCYAGTCKEASCSDGIKNGQESAIDCGGSLCQTCDVGSRCIADSDCSSKNCNTYTCAAPSCTNNKKDGFETSLNCGGSDCVACDLEQACLTNSDCSSNYCDQDKSCAIDPSIDSDGDGMADACEQEYFGCPTCANANEDPDKDRYTNAEECKSGTDPLDKNSVPTFEKLNMVAIILLALGGLLFLGGIGILIYSYLKDKDFSQVFSGSNSSSKESKDLEDFAIDETMPRPESIVNIRKNLTPEELQIREQKMQSSSKSKKIDRKKLFEEFGNSTSYKSPVKEAPREVKIQKEATKEKPDPIIKKEYVEVNAVGKNKPEEDIFKKLAKVNKAKSKSKK